MEFNIVKPTKEQLETAAQTTRPELERLLDAIAGDIAIAANNLSVSHGEAVRSTMALERRQRRMAMEVKRMAYLYVRISKLLMKKPIDKPKITKYDNDQYVREHGAL